MSHPDEYLIGCSLIPGYSLKAKTLNVVDHPNPIESELSAAQRSILLDLALLVNERRSAADVYGLFLARMREVADFEFSALLSIDADSETLRVLGRFPNWAGSVPVGDSWPAGAFPDAWLNAGGDGAEFVPTVSGETELERRLANRGLGHAWGATLYVGDAPAGLLVFARRDAAPVAPKEVAFFRAAGRLLASAFAQDSLLRRAERDAVRGQLLHELAVLLNAGEPVAALFERMLVLIERAIPLDYVVLAAAGKDDAFEVLGSFPPEAAPNGSLFGIGTLAHERVLLSDEGVLDFEAGESEGQWGAYFKSVGVDRALVCTLREGGLPVGLLTVGRGASACFSADEQEFARRLATILGQAIANERRIARSHAAAARARVLNELSVLLNDGETVEAIFERLAAILEGALEFDYVGIGACTIPDHLRLVGVRPPLLGEVGSEINLGEAAIAIIASTPGAAAFVAARSKSPAVAPLAAAGIAHGATAALRDGNEMLGAFTVARKRDEPYAPEDLEFIRLLGTMLGQSMASQRRIERASAEAARKRLLNEVALLVNAGEPAGGFFDQLSELLSAAMPFESMALLLPEPGGLNMRVAGSLRSNSLKPGVLVPLSALGVDTSAEGNTVSEQDASAMVSPLARAAAASGVRRIATATMRDGQRLSGILAVGRLTNRPFTAPECEILHLLGTYLGQSLANEHRLEETRMQGARSLLLSEVAVLLNDGKPTEDVFARVVDLMRPILRWDRCSLLMRGEATGDFIVRKSFPGTSLFEGMVVPFASIPISGDRWATEPSLVFRPAEMPMEITQRLADEGAAWALTSALRDGARVLGLISIARNTDTPFTPADIALFEFVATLLARSVAAEQRIAATEAEAARASLLNQLGLLLNAGEDVEKLFDRLPAMLGKAVDFDYVGMAVEAGRPGYLKAVDWNSREPVNPGPKWVSRDAVRMDSPLAKPGAVFQFRPEAQPTGTIAAEFAQMGVGRSAVALLGTPERQFGILHLARARPERFRDEEMAFLEVVATFFSQAVGNQLRLIESNAEAEEQGVIAEVAAAAAAESDPGALVGALQALRRLIPRPFAAFGYLDGDEVAYPAPGGEITRWPIDQPSYSALKSGQVSEPEIPDDFPKDDILRSAGVHALSHTVARSGGLVVGFLLVGSRQEGFVFEERELRILRVVAQIVGPAMENARAAQRSRLEADEQRLLAEIATVAAIETGEVALLAALVKPVGFLVRRPLVGYGHLEGDVIAYPTPGENEILLPLSGFEMRARDSGCAVGSPADFPPGHPAHGFGGYQICTVAYQAGGAVAGLLAVSSRDESFRFGEREQRIFRLIAQIVGPAMENARAVERARIEAEEQRILAEVAAVAARETEPVALLRGLVAPLRVLLPRPFVAYAHLDGDNLDWVRVPGSTRRPLTELAKSALEFGQSTGAPAPSHPDDIKSPVLLTHLSYTTALSGGLPIGLLHVATREPGHTFGEREKRLFRLIAQIVGPAMENVRSARRAKVEAEEQRVLADAASAAARGSTIAEIVAALPDALSAFVPGAFTLYGRLDEHSIIYDTVTPAVTAIVGSDELQLPLSAAGVQARDEGHGMGSFAWTHGEEAPANWSDPADAHLDVMRRLGRTFGIHQYCLLPYHAAGAPVGLLMVASTDPAFTFQPEHIALLARVAQTVGPAIEAVRAAANIARQRELYDLIIRSLTEGVILLDLKGQLVFANAFGTTLFEAVNPGGVAKSFEDLIPLTPESVRANFSRSIREGIATSGRTKMVIEGKDRWIDYELAPLHDGHSKLLIVTGDVTATVRREIEQQTQRDQLAQASRLVALGELIGGVAHELNNPLTAVLGFSEILAQAPAAAGLGEEIAIIQKEALRARNIVRDLLFIARPSPVEQAEVALSDVVGHIERLRRAAWMRAGIAVEIDIDGDACHVWGNEHQLAQVLLNLITNAEHALEGGGSIFIGGRCTDANVEVTVRDTGVGMTLEIAERVFEPFFTTKQSAGTGLGLSLSRTIVLSHGGTLSVESQLGVGTTFTVSLPVHTPRMAEPPAPPPSPAGGPMRVLVVDDEPSLRKVCQRLVVSMGHECSVAEGSASAVALASVDDFDVVLCDYRLATETADAVIAGFVKHAPQLIERTVIATGATTDAGVVDLTTRFGLRLMAKPYGGDELAGLIADAYRRRAS